MDPLSFTASLIAVIQVAGAVISTCYEYRQGVKGQHKAIIRTTQELTSLREVLDRLLQLVEDEGTSSSRLATVQALCKSDGPLISCQKELEELAATLNAEKSKWKAMRDKIIWPLKEAEVEKAISQIRNTKNTLQFALAADQTKAVLKIQDSVACLTEKIAVFTVDDNAGRVYSWLDAPDPFANHRAARQKKTLPHSGQWFLREKSFEAWKEGAGELPVFWLQGIPGAGKSVLCSTIIDHLFEVCQHSTNTALLYFYFDFNDTEKSSVDPLLRSLVGQLSVQVPTLPDCLQLAFEQAQRRRETQPTLDLLKSMLIQLLGLFSATYIIIDALDECTGYEAFIDLIADIQSAKQCTSKILVTSRLLGDIEQGLEPYVYHTLRLQLSSKQDILDFVEKTVAEDKRLARWPTEIKNDIIFELVHNANGMFRWVYCQLELLRKCATQKSLKKALTTLPKDLYETYDRILSQVDDVYQQEVFRVLQWLAFARGPVSSGELVDMLATDIEDGSGFDSKQRMPNPNDIVQMCSALVTKYDTRFGYSATGTKSKMEWLRLSHFTVKEYLLSPQLRQSKISYYSMDFNSSHLAMAEACLVYLSSPEIKQTTATAASFKGVRHKYPLVLYAAPNWPHHIARVDTKQQPRATELAAAFFATHKEPDGGAYRAWVRALIPDAPNDLIEQSSPLYYAASFGLTSIVKLMLDTNADLEIDALSGRAVSTPLHVACYRGRTEIVRMLLERGANPNILNTWKESALFWAAYKHYDDIVALLQKYNAQLFADELRSSTGCHMPWVEKALQEMETRLKATETSTDGIKE